jgi:Uma2 family endonuclease
MSVLDHLADIAPERVRPLRRPEYEKMVAEGRFEGERVELLEGVIVEMSPQDPRHAGAVQRLTRVLGRALAGRADVRVQLPLAVAEHSLPEPDVALVELEDFDEVHPTKAFLVVEVAEASLRKDRSVKAALYARAGVPEYWVVNLVDRLIEVHGDIVGAAYTAVTTAGPGESIRLRAFPDVEVAVGDIVR